MMVVKWIIAYCPPSNPISIIEDIRKQLKKIEEFKIQHFFREANKVVDAMANSSLQKKERGWFYTLDNMHREARTTSDHGWAPMSQF